MNRIQYGEITVQKITRNVFIAKTIAWIGSHPRLKMTFEIAGHTEQEARSGLIKAMEAEPSLTQKKL